MQKRQDRGFEIGKGLGDILIVRDVSVYIRPNGALGSGFGQSFRPASDLRSNLAIEDRCSRPEAG